MQKINTCLQLVRVSSRQINKIRSSNGESQIHKDKKEEICNALEANNHSYICEPIFKKKDLLKPDILVLDMFKVIEIRVSESDKSLELKRIGCESLGLEFEVIRCQKKKED